MCLLATPRFPLWIFLLGLWFGANAVLAAGSREVRAGPPPGWVEELPLDIPTASPETSIGWHYLLTESQTHAENRTAFHRNAYRIVSDLGLRYGSQINLSFDPSFETLTFHHIRLIRDGRVVDKLDPARIQVLQQEEDLQRLIYNGELSALLILEDVRVGDIVDYAYSKEGRNPVFGDHYLDYFPLEWGVPVGRLRHRLVHAPTRPVADRTAGRSAAVRTERRTPWGHERIWEARDLPAVVQDNNVPDWHASYAYVQLTDFPTWRAVIEWALPYYRTDADPGPELRRKAAELAAAGATPEERALAALKFVQEEVRYLGIELGANSHQPTPPAEVFARRFGDCKDKSLLLCQLLRLMDIKAAPVLVHTGLRHTLAEWLPSPYAFDHVIVLAWIGQYGYQLDPTLSYQRGSLAHRHTTRHGPGLVVEPAFQDLFSMPAVPNDISGTQVQEVFTVTGLQAPADFTVRTVYTGRAANAMRAEFAGTTRDELSKDYLDFYARYYPEITVARPLAWRDDDAANIVTVDEHYRINNLFARSADQDGKLLVAEFYPTALNDQVAPVGAAGRTAPLHLDHPVAISSHTILNLPDDWNFSPSTHEVGGTGFKFSRVIGGSPRRLEFTYRWDSLADHVKPEDFTAHVRNLAKVNDLFGYQLSHNEAVAGVAGYALNWAMIGLQALTVLAALAAGILIVWRTSVTSPPPQPPPVPGSADARLTGLGGWLLLVGLGIVLRPVVMLHQLVTSAPTYFNLDAWRAVTTPGLSTYLPAFAVAAPLEMVLDTLIFMLSLLLVLLFFRRNRAFPRLMIVFLALLLVSAVSNAWAQAGLKAGPAEEAEAYKLLVQAFAAAMVWIPYFLVSRRVRLTFTR